MEFIRYFRAQWDRASAIGLALLGLLVLVLGWVGVSGTPYLAKQMPYLVSGGLGGIFLLGVATALWLSADLRDEWRQLREIESALRDTASPVGRNGLASPAVPENLAKRVGGQG
jgi:hypothetical protein